MVQEHTCRLFSLSLAEMLLLAALASPKTLCSLDKTALETPLVDVTSIPNIFPGRSTEAAAVAFFFPWIDDSPESLTSQI